MKKVLFNVLIILAAATSSQAQRPSVIKLKETTLMHESRSTPYPMDKAIVNDRAVSFQWPLPEGAKPSGAPLDGFEDQVKKIDKSKIAYRIRYSQDAGFKKGTVQAETRWPFYNPEKPLAPGVWYWQTAMWRTGAPAGEMCCK